MKKALKNRKLFAVISIISAVVAVGTMIGALLFVSHGMYYGMLAMAIASAIGVYFVVFFSFAAFDAKQAIKVIELVNELGTMDVSAIAEGMMWREKATEKFVKKCKKHGYFA